jgi:hypothetical protein
MRDLAPFRIRTPDHRNVLHLRVAAKGILDLGRVGVLAARDNHVVLAVDQDIKAVCVAPGHVAH